MDPKNAQIVYPCLWIYAVIGTDEAEMRSHIDSVFRGHTHRVDFSKKSAQGKYCSLQVEIKVDSETQRNHFYQELKKSPVVKMVL